MPSSASSFSGPGVSSVSSSLDKVDRNDNHQDEELPAFFTEHLYIQQSPGVWTRQCECGGIGDHNHQFTMNGAGGGESATPSTTTRRNGRLPNYVQIAKSYVFEQEIQKCLRDTGVSQAREDNIRLAGVQWIDNVRRALKLPVKTFNTAVVYYHKFRLQHSDGEYSFVDAAAAALFTACKVEDTLKKSRDILCAAHNLKVPRHEQLSPDDQVFEQQSRTIIGLERLMLEASGFDFRNRHPQELLIKLAKLYKFERTSPVVKAAYSMSLDLYRTFAPLKQQTATLAFACLELSGRLLGQEHEDIWRGRDYRSWKITRGMVMETLLDLLELYTHHRTSTAIGPDFPVDTFLTVRIPLNLESEDKNIPRYTVWVDGPHGQAGVNGATNGSSHGRSRSSSKNVSPKDVTSPSTNNSSVSTAATSLAGAAANAAALRQRAGDRGREGTVRFILNPDREREEKSIVESYRRE
ncbi:RNA polymerase II C-terminal domain kinase beta subunit [Exophiala sideris]|uniref:RNA polymerase II holoenzyme cyclin-like subunit n=1 Tax=Exophiala sideris TaxID=1016849 RepID=A0ABR0JQA3_9EURO|nr:RNA polymerase II C-terminal domain kinase beta subunit [Exophiala sideris]KAK5041252.1 RNA polymerase II C-terminal domain kinase beta subunit [Exophiala sideris]KAK5068078.1 RNA polymerase II C-terminal domain kinase beta subunit [Exophiala sideris]KAK5187379.1 RNA polymerase II C-terminal domain kinase beta subunit [Eurotiomycetes sp. CCFEE 6388]